MSVRPLLIAAVLTVALPAGASAKLRPYIPPGNSGANQYVESVPTAGGDNSARNVISGDRGSSLAPSTSSLAPSTQSALTRAGRDGRATAAVANATAPKSRHHRVHAAAGAGTLGGGGGTFGGAGGASTSQGGASPVRGVLSSLFGLQGQGGLGRALPAILIAIVLALGAGRVWRRRTS